MTFQYKRLVQFYETDAMQIVHHSNYFRWFEEARIAWLADIGLNYFEMEAAGISVPVLRISCDYQRMLRFGDEVLISVLITKLTPVRLNLAYQLLRLTEGGETELTSLGESEHCFIDAQSQKPLSLQRRQAAWYNLLAAQVDKQVLTGLDGGK